MKYLFRSLSFLALSLCVSAYLAPVAFGQAPTNDVAALQSGESATLVQSDASIMPVISEGEMKASIIADISLRDVQFTEVDGVISGTFSLRGNLGQQNRIVTGVLALDVTGKPVDIAPLEKDLSVKEGVTDIRSFSYRLPVYLSGKVTFFIQAETEGGVLLGSQKILERDFPAKESLFRCLNEGSGAELSCVSRVNRAVLVSYYRGSFFSEPVKTNEFMLGEAPTTLAVDLPAGRYMVLVLDVETGERKVSSIRIDGSYGAIMNAVVFAKEQAGELGLTVATRVVPLKGTQVSGTLVGNDGKPCGSGSAEGTTSVFDLSLVSTCTMGTLKVELKDASGQVLDTLEEPFHVTLPATVPIAESVPSQSMTTESPVSLIALIVIASVLLIGVGLWFLMRRKQAKIITPLLFLFTCSGLFGTMVPKADALSWVLERYSPDRGEWAWTCIISVDLDKTTYMSGETATISVVPNANFLNDAGAIMGQEGNCSATYGRNSADTTAAFDSEAIGSFVEIARASGTPQWSTPVNIWFSGSKTFTIPGTMPTGAHSVRYVAVGMGAPCYVNSTDPDPCSGTLSSSGSLGFTVTAVNEPIGDVNADWGDCTNGVYGWACDKDNPNASIDVHVYDGSTFLGSTTANLASGDSGIDAACGNSGSSAHRFYFPIPVSMRTGTNKTLSVYGINIGPTGSNNPYIDAKTINCPVPTVNVYYP